MGETTGAGTHRANHARLLLVLSLGVAATSFPTTLLSASLDKIGEDLNSSLATISWVQVAPSLAFGMGMPLSGKLGDLYGHRRVFLGGLVVSLIAAVLTIVAWDPISLIVIRTIGQLGGAASGPSGFAIIAASMNEAERGPAIGRLNVVGGLSPVLGVIVGGPLIDAVGWRTLFGLQLVPATAALVLALPWVPDTPTRPNVAFDVPGAVTLSVASMALLLGINRAGPLGAAHPFVVVCLFAAPLLFVAFFVIERAHAEPLLPLRYLTDRPFAVPVGSMFLAQAAFIGSFVITPIMIHRLFGYSITVTSLLLTTRPTAFSVGAWLSGRKQDTPGIVARTQLCGNGLLAVGTALMVYGVYEHSIWIIEAALIISGFGNGYSRTTMFTVLSAAVDRGDVGTTTGVANMVGQIGAAVGTTVLSVIVADHRVKGPFVEAFIVAAVIAAVTIPVFGLLRPQKSTSKRRNAAKEATTRPI